MATDNAQIKFAKDPVPAAPPQQAAVDPRYAEYGRELVHSGLYGMLLAGGAAGLYNLINGAQSSDVVGTAKLLRNQVPNITLPHVLDEAPRKKKIKKQSLPGAAQLKAAAQKDAGVLEGFYDTVGRLIPQQFLPDLPLPPGSATESPNIQHRGWRTAANYAAAIAGGAGGVSLVNAFADKKRKEDLQEEVDKARHAYFDALVGKKAALLDAAYEKYAEGAATAAPAAAPAATPTFFNGSYAPWNWNWSNITNSGSGAAKEVGEGLWTAALLTGLGTGAIGAKYMYDQTRARTAAENLRRAAASRARLKSLHQTPWVDPDELASIVGK